MAAMTLNIRFESQMLSSRKHSLMSKNSRGKVCKIKIRDVCFVGIVIGFLFHIIIFLCFLHFNGKFFTKQSG